MGRHRLHDNPVSEYLSKALGQALWENKTLAKGKTQEEARQLFIARYGKNWLEDI